MIPPIPMRAHLHRCRCRTREKRGPSALAPGDSGGPVGACARRPGCSRTTPGADVRHARIADQCERHAGYEVGHVDEERVVVRDMPLRHVTADDHHVAGDERVGMLRGAAPARLHLRVGLTSTWNMTRPRPGERRDADASLRCRRCRRATRGSEGRRSRRLPRLRAASRAGGRRDHVEIAGISAGRPVDRGGAGCYTKGLNCFRRSTRAGCHRGLSSSVVEAAIRLPISPEGATSRDKRSLVRDLRRDSIGR